jgi:hypothetical protein
MMQALTCIRAHVEEAAKEEGKARLHQILPKRMKKTFLCLFAQLTRAQPKPNYKQELRPAIMKEATAHWDDGHQRGFRVARIFEAFCHAGVFSMSDGVATLASTLPAAVVEGDRVAEAKLVAEELLVPLGVPDMSRRDTQFAADLALLSLAEGSCPLLFLPPSIVRCGCRMMWP